jgi:hypothetical protein
MHAPVLLLTRPALRTIGVKGSYHTNQRLCGTTCM